MIYVGEARKFGIRGTEYILRLSSVRVRRLSRGQHRPQKPNSTLREGRRDCRDFFGDVPSSFLYSLTLRWHSSHTPADGTGDITAQPLQRNNVITILGS